MPGAAVLAGVKGPRVGLGSVLVGQGNERVLVSGVGAEERLRSPHGGGRSSTSINAPAAAEVHRFVIAS